MPRAAKFDGRHFSYRTTRVKHCEKMPGTIAQRLRHKNVPTCSQHKLDPLEARRIAELGGRVLHICGDVLLSHAPNRGIFLPDRKWHEKACHDIWHKLTRRGKGERPKLYAAVQVLLDTLALRLTMAPEVAAFYRTHFAQFAWSALKTITDCKTLEQDAFGKKVYTNKIKTMDFTPLLPTVRNGYIYEQVMKTLGRICKQVKAPLRDHITHLYMRVNTNESLPKPAEYSIVKSFNAEHKLILKQKKLEQEIRERLRITAPGIAKEQLDDIAYNQSMCSAYSNEPAFLGDILGSMLDPP